MGSRQLGESRSSLPAGIGFHPVGTSGSVWELGIGSSLIVRDGGRLAAIGVVLGLVAAALTTRVLGSMLFEVNVIDPSIFGIAAATLTAVALGASWLPARTATKVDPLHSLRADG